MIGQSAAKPNPVHAEGRRVLIISRHDYRTRRRASVHFVARHMAQQGHQVTFMSIGYSWLSRLRGDSRADLFDRANAWEQVDGLQAYLWRSAWHPVKLPVSGKVESWLYSKWARNRCTALDEAAGAADIIIVEIRHCAGIAEAHPSRRTLGADRLSGHGSSIHRRRA